MPGPVALEGRYARLERLGPGHAAGLWESFAGAPEVWAYMAWGPFADAPSLASWVAAVAAERDPLFYAILGREAGARAGVAAFLAARPAHGVVEVGAITFAPRLQRTRAATEAIALMGAWAFEAGYRRLEWKCNALNAASRRAAARLGFSYEGTFRAHMIQKGRARDTAWFAITEAEWPSVRAAWEGWLDPANFDATGRQRRRLSALTAGLRVAPRAEADAAG
jgi:RimJ/RimL family protein N-acetyltransferase